MNCPTDATPLTMSERSGIEIDYCPECRGVWLDRGELDKIIERSLQHQQPAPPPQQPRGDDRGYQRDRDERFERDRPAPYGYEKRKRRESWLSELFD